MEAQTIKDYTDLLTAVRDSMNEYLLTGELHGVACAAGTLTSRVNNLKIIVAAYEERTPNEKDRFEISSLVSTLGWLGHDKDCMKDFTGIKLKLPETAFNAAYPDVAVPGEIEYLALMTMLRSAAIEIVLEGRAIPLSA